ncbi:MAG: maleylpyruvate isomerase family mycothiol-dependent enzyme [Actinobacteria bacterium]|nr:maleylpyruvate isomerase family mycothiol-dependent enzyme [Actinomycetota bacterium]
MDRLSYLAALERDGEAFADSCAAAGLDAPVASCPGWSVADLVWHLAEVHWFWTTVVREQLTSPSSYEEPARPADGELLASYRSGLVETVRVLTEADPDTVVWTWTPDHTAGWVVRRMAHETAVHRWDADQASRRDMPIEAELASDGIDEFLHYFMGHAKDGVPAVGGSVHIHCTDVAGEWTARPNEAGGFDITREHAKGDCAIRGSASDILLALWRRQPLDGLDVVGDADVAARFVARNDLN